MLNKLKDNKHKSNKSSTQHKEVITINSNNHSLSNEEHNNQSPIHQ